MQRAKMTMAISHDDSIVSITDVDKGLGCNCHCLGCGTPLVAKKGSSMAHHFAHHVETGAIERECSGALETEIHIRAKRYVQKQRKLLLPVGLISPEPKEFEFQEVLLEKRMTGNKYIPDATAIFDGEKVLIEIAVTHFCEPEKIQALKDTFTNAVEFDFSDFTWEGEVIRDEDIANHFNTKQGKWLSFGPSGAVGRLFHERDKETYHKQLKIYQELTESTKSESQRLREIRLEKNNLTESLNKLYQQFDELQYKNTLAKYGEGIEKLSEKYISKKAEFERLILEYDSKVRNLKKRIQEAEESAKEKAILAFDAEQYSLKQAYQKQLEEEAAPTIKELQVKKDELAQLQSEVAILRLEKNTIGPQLDWFNENKDQISEAQKKCESTCLKVKHLFPVLKSIAKTHGHPWPFAESLEEELAGLVNSLIVE